MITLISMDIETILARQIFDSRGNPTVEADVYLANGHSGRAAVPSGASTGSNEALELRDGGKAYGGKGVLKAVQKIEHIIAPELVGKPANEQSLIDTMMCSLDGTHTKKNLGANAILAVSLAVAKAAAAAEGQALYEYISSLSGSKDMSLPMPMMNIINGGKHAAGSTDVQEFMIMPLGAKTFQEVMQMGTEIFHELAYVLKKAGYGTTVGDEGGFAPAVQKGNAEALDLICKAIDLAGYKAGTDVGLALDVASSELRLDRFYMLKTEKQPRHNSHGMVEWYQKLVKDYPIVSIEDGMSENDWTGWEALTRALGEKVQLVGDDLLVTNVKFLEKAIKQKAANAILIKPNQIGTLTETIHAVAMAKNAGWHTIMSHRSGETEDVTIAHLAVGLNCGQIKTGSLSRTDRVAKYNELLRISEHAGMTAVTNPFAV